MKSILPSEIHRHRFQSACFLFTLAAATAANFFSVHPARATDGLAYSFEDDLQGFHPNGNITLTQDTIGATNGTKSMKISVAAAGTFEGALSEGPAFDTNIISDPPGLDHVHFDLTIVQRFDVENPNPPPAGRIGFANIGVTMWGATQPDFPGGQQFGIQAQLARTTEDEFKIGALEPGTYKDVRIDLDKLTDQLDFSIKSFNDLFGTVGSGSHLVPTGFQFYFNKNDPAGLPLDIYIDNIRFGMSVPGDYDGNDVVDANDYVLWRKTPGAVPLNSNFRNEVVTPGTVEPGDYTAWRARFGSTSAGSGLENGSVPEPTSAWLLLIAAGAGCCGRKRRNSVG